jgi:hypothetical protein
MMALAYVVRCNFNTPEKEAAWNAWYSGPKLKQMLDKPYFLTVRRFEKVRGAGRNYLAYWTIESAQAFETPEYKNDWGFFEWRPYIIDWSRDLFEALKGEVPSPRLGDGDVLRLVSFEGADAVEAEKAIRQIDAARMGTAWMRSAGLDRHSPYLGVSVESAETRRPPVPAGVIEGFYRPISDFTQTDRKKA